MDLQEQRNLGDNLRLLRSAYGYTQAEVAEELHICRSSYTLYELGKKIPSVDMLIDLADLYHVRMDVLLDSKTDFYIQRVLSNEGSRNDVQQLINTFYRLTPHAQGKLLERADALLELEKVL